MTTVRAIFIPVQFQDQEMSLPVEVLEQRVSDAQRYWADQYADGKLFTFELAPLVTLSKSIAYYGANYTDRKDVLITEAAKSACNSVNDFVDFSSYDLVGLICAGVGESYTGESDGIWPQYINLSDFSSQFFLDGRTINDICITCESTGITELCHEFGHYLGLPDFYDIGFAAVFAYSAAHAFFRLHQRMTAPVDGDGLPGAGLQAHAAGGADGFFGNSKFFHGIILSSL